MIGASPVLEPATRSFIAGLDLINLNDGIAARAVEIRREHRIRLPDAIIWTTADVGSKLLVTRNAKDCPSGAPGVRIPYIL